MAGFASIAELCDTEELVSHVVSFRKVSTVATPSGVGFDYSMAPGNPSPQYYAATPLNAQSLSRSGDGGLNHGGNVAPATKYLRKLMVTCNAVGGTPQRLTLLDYLLFYPFVDMGTADEQTLVNNVSLPRYTDGEGVQIMAVIVAPHGAAGDSFTVTYTNQDGVPGRSTGAITMTTAAALNGVILTTQNAGAGRVGPYLPLQGRDTGVRSLEAVQCTAGIDVGLFSLVLVKPLADISLREITAPTEIDFWLDRGGSMPVIQDDAFLNFIGRVAGSINNVSLTGLATFTWK